MPVPENAVRFYSGPFYCLDNFSAFTVEIDGQLYPTVEHAYQEAKFGDESIRELVRFARSAHEAKKIARRYSGAKRASWHEVKVVVMERLLRAKLGCADFLLWNNRC